MTDDELFKRVEKHDHDLYRGNGWSPALTVRMSVAEERLENVKNSVDEIKRDHKVIRNMVIGLILTVVGQIVVALVVHKW